MVISFSVSLPRTRAQKWCKRAKAHRATIDFWQKVNNGFGCRRAFTLHTISGIQSLNLLCARIASSATRMLWNNYETRATITMTVKLLKRSMNRRTVRPTNTCWPVHPLLRSIHHGVRLVHEFQGEFPIGIISDSTMIDWSHFQTCNRFAVTPVSPTTTQRRHRNQNYDGNVTDSTSIIADSPASKHSLMTQCSSVSAKSITRHNHHEPAEWVNFFLLICSAQNAIVTTINKIRKRVLVIRKTIVRCNCRRRRRWMHRTLFIRHRRRIKLVRTFRWEHLHISQRKWYRNVCNRHHKCSAQHSSIRHNIWPQFLFSPFYPPDFHPRRPLSHRFR